MDTTSDFSGLWAIILGGSSGFGLASAKELASRGMNICIVHRDRRGAMERIEVEFDTIRSLGVELCTYNTDALSQAGIDAVLEDLSEKLNQGGDTRRVRVLLHSIAYGSLKLLVPQVSSSGNAIEKVASQLQCDPNALQQAIDKAFEDGEDRLSAVATAPQYEQSRLLDDEELAMTVHAMGTSLLSWTRAVFSRGLFAPDARVLGLTSEGNEVSWLGYAAVSAAKAALESLSRSIAKELGPHGIRSNILQPGVTDTPALRLIPGSKQLMGRAKERNPLGRLTEVEDVARVVALLASDEAAWINGSLIRVDGGERISG